RRAQRRLRQHGDARPRLRHHDQVRPSVAAGGEQQPAREAPRRHRLCRIDRTVHRISSALRGLDERSAHQSDDPARPLACPRPDKLLQLRDYQPAMIIDKALAKVFGTANERELKRLQPAVAQINALEPSIKTLSDEQLRGKTAEFRLRVEQGETLDDLLPEAFAVVREAGRRTLNMRHFDVQLIGGMVLHRGKIAEMKTGEGKTLVATLPAYLNALAGQGVHVVTVNDYLARRDSEWMGRIYRFLGMTVGVIQHDLND